MSTKTLIDIFFHATRDVGSERAFQHKVNNAYRAVSAQDFEKMCFEVALGLKKLGLSDGERVAIISPNRLEWPVCDYGILLNGGVNVPIYQTLIPEQIRYILDNSGSRFVFCSDREQCEKILEILPELPGVERIIQFDDAVDHDKVLNLEELKALGKSMPDDAAAELEKSALNIGLEQTCSIIYTSGTTGAPKGVVLSHGNITSNVLAGLQVFDISDKDTALSFLPLSHIFERMVGYYTMFYAGASIAYAESIDTVPQNLQELHPTVMVSVPRLYEKMYARILDTALSGSFVKKNIFFWAKRTGESWADKTLDGEAISGALAFGYRVAAKLVFSKLKERTGGKLRYFISGGAPLAAEIARFFYAAGLIIYEGYGLTETSPVLTANNDVYGLRLGTVGKCLPGVEVKIADDGEILVRGPNIMKGYFNNEAATKEVLSEDGWFATGDIGELDSDGFLKITDRKKDIIVTAGGKNVAPQMIENIFKTDKFISECVVVGDKQPFIGALIVPNFDYAVKYAKRHDLAYTSMKGLLQLPRVLDLYRRRVELLNERLSRYERVKRFKLVDQELTQEAGHLTPSLKVKRKKVLEMYADLVASIYSDSETGSKPEE